MVTGSHLLGVVRWHPPDPVRREEYLALVPAIVVLSQRLETVRGAVHDHEIAVPLRRVQDERMAERTLEVVSPAILLEDARLERGAWRPLPDEPLHSRKERIDGAPIVKTIAAHVN